MVVSRRIYWLKWTIFWTAMSNCIVLWRRSGGWRRVSRVFVAFCPPKTGLIEIWFPF